MGIGVRMITSKHGHVVLPGSLIGGQPVGWVEFKPLAALFGVVVSREDPVGDPLLTIVIAKQETDTLARVSAFSVLGEHLAGSYCYQ
jgi:hypothetical protein